MTIVDRDGIINGLSNNNSPLLFDKATIINIATGNFVSLWRAAGTPPQAATPTTAAICSSALLGAFEFINQTPPSAAYIGQMWHVSNRNGSALEVHDRLAHMGGLSGTVTATQGALNLNALPAARLGRSNYADVQWWLEWYVDSGATSVNATVNVTYDDNTTGALAAVALGATPRAGRMFPLRSAVAGKFIKAVNSVQLSASTGTAGNFGITASRMLTALYGSVASKVDTFDWAALGLPKVENDACLFLVAISSGSSSSELRGGGKFIYG
jgi:hypothetical protein